jgi:uncharacterized LabA/DUF88 family protein
MKTYAYIDGFNLYSGLMDKRYTISGDTSQFPLRKYLWLKIDDFIHSFLQRHYNLAQIKYFTAPIRGNPKKQYRQETYIKALETLPNINIILGKHIPIGKTYSEKQTDVLMALHMYTDARDTKPNAIVLVSGDSDQVPTLNWIKQIDRDIEIHVIFPPFRVSKDLRKAADFTYNTKWKRLRQYQFPETVVGKGYSVSRPKAWK